MATKQKVRSGKTALKAAKEPAAPKVMAAKRAAPTKPVAKKATASFRGGPQVAARAPAASFALKFPLGNDARVVLDGLSRSVVDTFLTRTNKAPKDKSLEDRARVQVRKGGRWVGVPGVDAGGLAAAAMAATVEPVVSLPTSSAAAAGNTEPAVRTLAGFAASEAGFLGELPARLAGIAQGELHSLHRVAGGRPATMDARLMLAVRMKQFSRCLGMSGCRLPWSSTSPFTSRVSLSSLCFMCMSSTCARAAGAATPLSSSFLAQPFI